MYYEMTDYPDINLTVDFITLTIVDDIDCEAGNEFVLDTATVLAEDTVTGLVSDGISESIVLPQYYYRNANFYGDLAVCGTTYTELVSIYKDGELDADLTARVLTTLDDPYITYDSWTDTVTIEITEEAGAGVYEFQMEVYSTSEFITTVPAFTFFTLTALT